jgi:hypothetical protein
MENKKEWYEVFRKKFDESTETIMSCDSYSEAIDFVYYRQFRSKEKLYIDKWNGDTFPPKVMYN